MSTLPSRRVVSHARVAEQLHEFHLRRQAAVLHDSPMLGPHAERDGERRIEARCGGQRDVQGYLRAMKTHRLAVDPELVHQGEFTFASGVEAAHHLLSRRTRPSAVFASNDDMALGVLASAQRLGLSVPGELSIAGFDDSNAAGLVWPPLRTVRQPMYEMARVAVEMLIVANRSDVPPLTQEDLHRVLKRELVVRASTSAPTAKSSRLSLPVKRKH